MPRINLLPWREQQRKERKLAFFVALGGAAIGALLVAFAGYLLVNSMISAQERRNERLRVEIKGVDRQIEQINDLETQKQRFISRMQVIDKRASNSRPEMGFVNARLDMLNADDVRVMTLTPHFILGRRSPSAGEAEKAGA